MSNRFGNTYEDRSQKNARDQFAGGASLEQVIASGTLSENEVLGALRNADGKYVDGKQEEINKRLAGLGLLQIE